MSTTLSKPQLAAYKLRRIAQTWRTFENWPTLLGEMGREAVGKGAATLTFVTRDGLTLSCPNIPGARLPMYEQFADDCYEMSWLLEPFAGREVHVLDIGAHVGAFACRLASLHPQASVDCFEPSPDTLDYLRRNVEQNGLGGRIRVHGKALAAEEGTAQLDDNSGASVHNGLIRNDERLVHGDDALAQRHTITVETTTFDKAVAEAGGTVELVKMDCEGGEYGLVYGSSPQSWATVQRIVMEHHPVDGESWDELRSWFATAGLHVRRDTTDETGLGTAWLSR
jgi:FkbM family methyltransferase